MQRTSQPSTPPPQAFPAPAPVTPPPKPNRELFHKKLPAAIKVTDVAQAKELLQQKVNEGFRWVTHGFINDRHTGYRVGVAQTNPIAENGDFIGAFPANFDVIVFGNTTSYIDISTGTVKTQIFTSDLTSGNGADFKKYLDNVYSDLTSEVRCLYPTPIMKAKQMPDIAEGDWVVLEGKVMRLVKANDPQCQNLEAGFVNAQLLGLNVQYGGNSEVPLPAVNLPEDFFPDSYARVAGAYIRRLERFQHLEPVFARFFTVDEYDSSDPAKKQHSKVNSILISLYGRADTKYTKFQIATLKLDPLTLDDLKLIKKSLGVIIDPAALHALPPKTIADVVPFKKILEILTYYNPTYGVPMVVKFKVGAGNTNFILSPDDQQPSQLIVSIQSGNLINGTVNCIGNAYPWWMNNYQSSGSPVSAPEANFILDRPLSTTTVITPKMIEFLACTHIAESHFTPGQLNSSRVPGSGKLARAVVRRHVTPTVTDLSKSFDVKEKTPYPMAATGGTGNTRQAVNSLRRNGGTRAENTYAFDMSDDSEVDL